MKHIITTLFACALGIATAAAAQSYGGDQTAPSTGSGSSTTPSTGSGSSEDQWNKGSSQSQTQSGTGSSAQTGASGSMSNWPSNVTEVSVAKGKKVEVSGSLSSGQAMEGFALPSSCMSSTEKSKLQSGNQVLYSFELPANVDATITVKPADPSTKLAVYAYELPQGKFDMPSASINATSCKIAMKGGAKADTDRVIRFHGAKDVQNVLIGIAQVNGASTGTGSSKTLQKKTDIDQKGSTGSGSSSDLGDVNHGGSFSGTGSSSDINNQPQPLQPSSGTGASGDINQPSSSGSMGSSGVGSTTGSGSSGSMGSSSSGSMGKTSGSIDNSSSTGAGTSAGGDFTLTIDLH